MLNLDRSTNSRRYRSASRFACATSAACSAAFGSGAVSAYKLASVGCEGFVTSISAISYQRPATSVLLPDCWKLAAGSRLLRNHRAQVEQRHIQRQQQRRDDDAH